MSESGATLVTLRPIGTPLPLGFLGLFVATASFSALQLGWVPPAQGRTVALAVLVLSVPVQFLVCILGFQSRDPVAGTGMGVLSGTWAAVALATLTSPPGASSAGLGVVLLASAGALLVPAAAGRQKTLAAGVMLLASVRFAATGVAEVTASTTWLLTAGWIGVVLAAASLYAALAFELEGTERRDVIPLFRRGDAASAVTDDAAAQLADVAREPGVRKQL